MQPSDTLTGLALPLGFELRHYELEAVLGRGGFGITYLALDTKLNRKVVIKENLPGRVCFRDTKSLKVCSSHPDEEGVISFQRSMRRFLEEARMMATLDHPGIIKVHDYFEANGTAYFVMPHVECKSLSQVIKAKKSAGEILTGGEIINLLKKILVALEYLHSRGVCHRDIKPENILVADAFEPILIDLGGVTGAETNESITVIESAGFTPPEQLRRRGELGAWTDIYALGATFWYVILGKKIPEAIDRITEQKDSWQTLAGRDDLLSYYSKWLLESVDKAVKLVPKERFQSASEWLELIETKMKDSRQPEVLRQDHLGDSRGECDLEDPAGYDLEKANLISEDAEPSTNDAETGFRGDSTAGAEESYLKSNSLEGEAVKGSVWKAALRWTLVLPGSFLGAFLGEFFVRIIGFLASDYSGSATWGEIIFHRILEGLAFGAGFVLCAYYIAPRGKVVVATTFAGMVLVVSLIFIVVPLSQNEWMLTLEVIFMNVGAIGTAIQAKNEGL